MFLSIIPDSIYCQVEMFPDMSQDLRIGHSEVEVIFDLLPQLVFRSCRIIVNVGSARIGRETHEVV